MERKTINKILNQVGNNPTKEEILNAIKNEKIKEIISPTGEIEIFPKHLVKVIKEELKRGK